MGLYFNKDVNTIYTGQLSVSEIYLGSTKVWPIGLPIDTTFDFDYTGNVQSIDLPQGYYKLQAWGAQGGNVTGSYSVAGSKGGYSEGILKLDSPTTLYVFVGGKGTNYTSSASQTSTTLINGGWNGGGCGARTCLYSSSDEDGKSFPRPGGGATDFALVTSSMSYSSNRTNRSSESLQSRLLVAGGGAGASAYYSVTGSSEQSQEFLKSLTRQSSNVYTGSGGGYWSRFGSIGCTESGYYIFDYDSVTAGTLRNIKHIVYDNAWTAVQSQKTISAGTPFYVNMETYPSSGYTHQIYVYSTASSSEAVNLSGACTYKVTYIDTTETDYGTATTAKQGGGTSGRGQYPGTQTSAGSGGGFGLGANQTSTNYMYCGGGGGGGWYGGGSDRADSNTSYINYCGGGSGYVKTSSNAVYDTNNVLLSGSTKAGNVSFPSTSGGSETGHSGNGYARITVVDENGEGGGSTPSTPSISIDWSTQTGTWNSSSNSSAYDGLSYTSNMYNNSGSTVIRCTFSGITSITFYCTQDSELNFDYLTLGYLDSNCTRSSYQYSMKGKTYNTYTYTCDTGEHYIEFCYSKDGSVSNGSDSATVYVSAVS